jgi:hypothetical protein
MRCCHTSVVRQQCTGGNAAVFNSVQLHTPEPKEGALVCMHVAGLQALHLTHITWVAGLQALHPKILHMHTRKCYNRCILAGVNICILTMQRALSAVTWEESRLCGQHVNRHTSKWTACRHLHQTWLATSITRLMWQLKRRAHTGMGNTCALQQALHHWEHHRQDLP